MLAGFDAGGERATAIYSLFGSAKLIGLNPEAYLSHVLEHIAQHPINASLNCFPGPSPHTSNRSALGCLNRFTSSRTVFSGRLHFTCNRAALKCPILFAAGVRADYGGATYSVGKPVANRP